MVNWSSRSYLNPRLEMDARSNDWALRAFAFSAEYLPKYCDIFPSSCVDLGQESLYFLVRIELGSFFLQDEIGLHAAAREVLDAS